MLILVNLLAKYAIIIYALGSVHEKFGVRINPFQSLFKVSNITEYMTSRGNITKVIRELKQRRRRRQRERQKSNRLRLEKQQHCACITIFAHFFAVVTRQQSETSCFVEDVNIRQQFSFS